MAMNFTTVGIVSQKFNFRATEVHADVQAALICNGSWHAGRNFN
jgi:hypothetical protein